MRTSANPVGAGKRTICKAVVCVCVCFQVFWVGLSLLHSHVVALYSAGLSLLAAYMKNLNLQQSKVSYKHDTHTQSYTP